ncbi:hypothetical protein Tco_1348682, partial [Tanacetum coccineum]
VEFVLKIKLRVSKAKSIAEIKGDDIEWEDIVQNLINAGNGNNIISVVRRLVFVTSVYSIWQERNSRIFKDVKRSSEDIYKHIVNTMKNKFLGITFKDAVRDMECKCPVLFFEYLLRPYRGLNGYQYHLLLLLS